MPTLDSLTFDETALNSREDQNGVRYWFTSQGDGCGLYFFDCAPDIGASLDSIDDLRAFFRQMTGESGLGLVEVQTLEVDGCTAVKTIVKAPQNPTGMTYIGSLVIPFRDLSYVLKVQCEERGITGVRDTVVLMEKMQLGQIQTKDGKPIGWWQDAYDPAASASVMRNLSDDEEHDAAFPEHPLSRVRSFYRHLLPTIRIAPEVKTASAFRFARSKPG